MDEKINLYRVGEGTSGESHLVVATSEGQARGIAFGHRFSDDVEDGWGSTEWPVRLIENGDAIKVGNEDGDPVQTAAKMLAEHRRTGSVGYLGGSLW